MTRTLWSPLAVLLLVPLFAACANPGHSSPGAGLSSSSAGASSRVASTAMWAAQGSRLIAAKASASSDPGIVSGGAWAYQSTPLDITANGTYVLSFVVPESFSMTPPAAQAYDFPSDTTFSVRPAGPSSLSKQGDGSQLLQSPISVSDLTATYPGFSAWVY